MSDVFLMFRQVQGFGEEDPGGEVCPRPFHLGCLLQQDLSWPADLDQRAEVVSTVELLPALLHTLLIGRKLLCVAWTWESAGTCRDGLT